MLETLTAVLLSFPAASPAGPSPVLPLHAAQDTRAEQLKTLQKMLRSKDPAERLPALRKIASIALEGDDGPDKDLARVIAKSIKDEDNQVRTEAARLLGLGQHPDVALPALARALDQCQKDLARTGRGDWGGGGGRGGRGGTPEGRKFVSDTLVFGRQVATSLGSMADDRAVDAVVKYYQRLPSPATWEQRKPIAEALVALQSRPCIKALVDSLISLGNRRDRRGAGQQQGGAGAGGGGRARGGGFGSDDSAEQVHGVLLTLARSKELEGMPEEWNAEAPELWTKWFAANQKHFEAKLGKLKVD